MAVLSSGIHSLPSHLVDIFNTRATKALLISEKVFLCHEYSDLFHQIFNLIAWGAAKRELKIAGE